jgi:hypothetical protein
MTTPNAPSVLPADGLFTLQWAAGGLFDGRLVPGYDVCLVRALRHGGTPGPTLCGRDRFTRGDGQPGWSVGGGISGPNVDNKPCAACVAVREQDYPTLAVAGMRELRSLFEPPYLEPWSEWWR